MQTGKLRLKDDWSVAEGPWQSSQDLSQADFGALSLTSRGLLWPIGLPPKLCEKGEHNCN